MKTSVFRRPWVKAIFSLCVIVFLVIGIIYLKNKLDQNEVEVIDPIKPPKVVNPELQNANKQISEVVQAVKESVSAASAAVEKAKAALSKANKEANTAAEQARLLKDEDVNKKSLAAQKETEKAEKAKNETLAEVEKAKSAITKAAAYEKNARETNAPEVVKKFLEDARKELEIAKEAEKKAQEKALEGEQAAQKVTDIAKTVARATKDLRKRAEDAATHATKAANNARAAAAKARKEAGGVRDKNIGQKAKNEALKAEEAATMAVTAAKRAKSESSEETVQRAYDAAEKANAAAERARYAAKQARNKREEEQLIAKEKDVIAVKPSSAEKYRMFISARENESKKKINTKYHWAVMNNHGTTLKDVYKLFAMKPVGEKDKRYFNMETCELLTEMQLGSYASTGVLCEYPNRDFRDEMNRVRNRHGYDNLRVTYYMWPDIANYFQYKAETAVQCLINRGQLPKDEGLHQNILVVGNVYKIKQPGTKKAIGLYLPSKIEYLNPDTGKRSLMAVPLDCFSGHKDIELLK